MRSVYPGRTTGLVHAAVIGHHADLAARVPAIARTRGLPVRDEPVAREVDRGPLRHEPAPGRSDLTDAHDPGRVQVRTELLEVALIDGDVVPPDPFPGAAAGQHG